MDRIAVLIPCYNEAIAIGDCIAGFRKSLPDAKIYVYDNNSNDDSVSKAAAAGAIVRHEPLQGKGNVVRRMFADIDADIYVMVDGDATYDSAAAPLLIKEHQQGGYDMVIARRINSDSNAYRAGHRFGNTVLNAILRLIFVGRFKDILSGYRVFSRRFVKSFPALATGFEIEVELTTHALSLNLPATEIDVAYFARPEGSNSKLHTYRDGIRILLTIGHLFRSEKPFVFFGIISCVLALISLVLSAPVITTYFETGLVPRLPTAILSASIMILACLSLMCGIILDTVTRGRRELKRLFYLRLSKDSRE